MHSIKWRTRPLRSLACGVFFLVFSSLAYLPAWAGVALASFTATPADSQVLLRWQTTSELDVSGYYVLRSLNSLDGFLPIAPFIPARGDEVTGSIYTYLDGELTNGTIYYYKLEVVASDQTSEFYGPRTAVPWSVSTTQTVTRTPVTATGQASTGVPPPTAAPSATAAPTRTGAPLLTPTGVNPEDPYPPPEDPFAISPFPTLQSEGSPFGDETPAPFASRPTATLVPLPSITIQFPQATAEGDSLAAGRLPGTPDLAARNGNQTQERTLRLFPLAILLIVWVFLGVWFYVSHRQT